MGRIIAIDYGTKRVGLAVSDEGRIIANPLKTVHSKDVLKFLEEYIANENVDAIVIGEPKQMDGSNSESEMFIVPFIKSLHHKFPSIPLHREDERFTSKIALQTMAQSGLKKKARQNKELLDTISATLILQSYLEKLSSKK